MKSLTEEILKHLGIREPRRSKLLNQDPTTYLTIKELQTLNARLDPPPVPPKPSKPKRKPKIYITPLDPTSGKSILKYKTRRRTVWCDPKLNSDEEKLKDLFSFIRQGETNKYMPYTDRLLSKKLKQDLEKLLKEDYDTLANYFLNLGT